MVGVLVDRLLGEIAAGGRPAHSPLPAVRELAVREGCAPGTVVRAYERLERLGLIERRPRARARLALGAQARAGRLLSGVAAPRLAGSDDPLLDLAVRAAGERIALAGGARGSVHGLAQLARGTAELAVVHLRDAATGAYNDQFVRELLGGEPVALVHLWRREQGLVLPRGNPRGVAGVADLAGLRLAWRAQGTATRLLLERLLHEERVEPDRAQGVLVESHREVAVAVASGAADAGLAVRAAAAGLELGFVPVLVEPFELAVPERNVDACAPLLEALAELPSLPGHDRADAGQVRRAA